MLQLKGKRRVGCYYNTSLKRSTNTSFDLFHSNPLFRWPTAVCPASGSNGHQRFGASLRGGGVAETGDTIAFKTFHFLMLSGINATTCLL